MDIEYNVLSEIEQGIRQIRVPSDVNGIHVIIKLIFKGFIKNRATSVTVLQNGAILNHYKVTQEGITWLTEQEKLIEAI